MFTVYVLKSLKNGKRYVGYTSKQASVRLQEHNSGSNKFTRENKPFKLILEEKYGDKKEAMKREKFLKSGQGRKFLDIKISQSSSAG
ncbi:MAG: GIY-YIG nuclease family protein [Candidatus Paceibacterota bacterium]